jgi:hypothetical protein
MIRYIALLLLSGFLALPKGDVNAQMSKPVGSPDWTFNATAIEACSCPMFCQCYFNSKPAGHGGHEGHGAGEHFCRANMAYKVNKGNYGSVNLDGVKFWLASDLGAEFDDGVMEWVELTFEPSATKEQRDAVSVVVGHLFPVKWNSMTVGKDASIEWQASKDRAVAKLDGGKAGEIVLHRGPGMTEDPVVIKNLKYWGAPRNDGFVLMPNEIEAYRVGAKPFEFKGTNGFMITVDMNSKDAM